MAKAPKKSAKEASSIFHNIMKASVKDNTKPARGKNYDFTEKIGGKQFHFRKDSDTKYSLWTVPIDGGAFFAEKNKKEDWLIYGRFFDTQADTAIKHHEESKKDQL